ncbi:hypothetical protein HPC49_35795 [Pyxidicoccus fallax]|uniref:Uncharacterized protein n=1 Tax=Pyxidicoccus fallax TaxID=394095 RepID=A0A848LUL9_9BACT|nr:DUF6152 family protein [Pyxidicoccus fallax]NMO21341.1 hypothetical protein [Pyxidicoccus fallax]NPC83574.1 hypothetical protein [Pyxidicoccus fallax]
MRTSSWKGALVALCVSGGALAHHGWSSYDSAKVMTLTGVIKESGYENPHGYIQLVEKEKTWRVILAPPSRMESRGLAASALKEGAKVTVEGYPHRTVQDELRAERITVGGKTVELR